MIGIILAGGMGTRLFPNTRVVSKQLLPIYDKPLIYYPLATLMSAGLKKIIIVTTSQDLPAFEKLLGDGSQLGIQLTYRTQAEPKGIAEVFLITADLIQGKKVALILGDNIFHGTGLGANLSLNQQVEGALIFGYRVKNPSEYGVVEFNSDLQVTRIEEKPKFAKSFYAIPGLYFYDEMVLEFAQKVTASERGELEITAVNQFYLERGRLSLNILPRGTTWLDTGNAESMSDASVYVRTIEERQGMKIACIEEIAFRNGWISGAELQELVEKYPNCEYKKYILELI
jgi:glucose-1-phosphate thymidylyltransferase